MEKEFVYAVTRIHSQEQSLLTEQDMTQLLAAQSLAACYGYLADKGWGAAGLPAGDSNALFVCEREKTWALIRELVGDLASFDIFRLENDFQNLKAAIKLVYAGRDREDVDAYFQHPGTVSVNTVLQAARQHDFSGLPLEALAEAGKKADEVLAHTANGQACEMVIDQAALVALEAAGKASGSELLRFYATLRADAANIKAAVRACRMGKERDFLERAIAPAGSLDAAALINAAQNSVEEICVFLAGTDYAQAANALRDSLASFETWCDRRLMEEIRPRKYDYFTIEPLAAYILARESEIAMVRLILSAKANHLDDALVRNRWRQMYV